MDHALVCEFLCAVKDCELRIQHSALTVRQSA